jgi:hypothetical protein
LRHVFRLEPIAKHPAGQSQHARKFSRNESLDGRGVATSDALHQLLVRICRSASQVAPRSQLEPLSYPPVERASLASLLFRQDAASAAPTQ